MNRRERRHTGPRLNFAQARPLPLPDSVPVCITMLPTGRHRFAVCGASQNYPNKAGRKPNVSSSPETVFVLLGAMGHNRPHAKTDHQRASAFQAHRYGDLRGVNRCGAARLQSFPALGDRFRTYCVDRQPVAGSRILTRTGPRVRTAVLFYDSSWLQSRKCWRLR